MLSLAPSYNIVVGIRDHLYSQEQSRRELAAYLLSKNNAEAVVKVLIEALRNPNRYVATRAAWGLALMRPALVVPYLERVLRGRDLASAQQAAWALGRIRNPKARRVLVAALENRRKIVRYQAASGLWRHAVGGYRSLKAEELLIGMLPEDTGAAAMTLRRMKMSKRPPKVRRQRGTVFHRMGGGFIR
jgi:hypothetical protein